MVARYDLLVRAVWWCVSSVAWAGIAGVTALVAGLVVSSSATCGRGRPMLIDRCGSDATSDAFAGWSEGRTGSVSALTFESPLAPNMG